MCVWVVHIISPTGFTTGGKPHLLQRSRVERDRYEEELSSSPLQLFGGSIPGRGGFFFVPVSFSFCGRCLSCLWLWPSLHCLWEGFRSGKGPPHLPSLCQVPGMSGRRSVDDCICTLACMSVHVEQGVQRDGSHIGFPSSSKLIATTAMREAYLLNLSLHSSESSHLDDSKKDLFMTDPLQCLQFGPHTVISHSTLLKRSKNYESSEADVEFGIRKLDTEWLSAHLPNWVRSSTPNKVGSSRIFYSGPSEV